MKRYFILILFLSFQPCKGQSDSQNIAFVAYWSIGDSYDFKITKIKKQWKDSQLSTHDSTQYISNFLVIDSTGSTYTIKWTFKQNIIDTYEIPEEIIQRLPNNGPTEVVYKTTELGQFLGIENWESLGNMMNNLLNEVIQIIANETNNKSQELLENMKSLISILGTKEGLEKLIFKELRLIHFPFGTVMYPNKPLKYKDSFPNMLGGKPMKANAKISVESVDYDSSECVLQQEENLDPRDTKKYLKNVIESLSMDKKEMKSTFKGSKYNVSDRNRYEYYYYPGIPKKIETERTMIFLIQKHSQVRVDKIKIELINKYNVL